MPATIASAILSLVAKAVSNKKVCYEPRLDRGEGVIQ